MPDSAASSPRSSRTAGCRPRTAAQLRERLLGLVVGLLDGPARRRRSVGGQGGASHPEVEREGGETLLGAVVEVPLDAAPLGVRGVDDPRAGLLEGGDARRELLSPGLAEHRAQDREVEGGEPTGQPWGDDETAELDRRLRPDAADALEHPTGEGRHLRADPRPQRRGHEHEATSPAERDEGGRGREQDRRDERVVGQLTPRRRPAQPRQPAAPARCGRSSRRGDGDAQEGGCPRPVPAAQALRHDEEQSDERDPTTSTTSPVASPARAHTNGAASAATTPPRTTYAVWRGARRRSRRLRLVVTRPR